MVIDPEKSREAIVKLSELLRFTLQYGKERFIPLKMELQEVTKYLELEQLRFGERLNISFEIPDHLQQVSIPPAMVLTLAENAIKHGVAKHMGNGFVQIRISEDSKDCCTVYIINTGTYQPDTSTGIGLKHVNKRLEEIYKGKASFSIVQHDQNVLASLKLPLQ